MMLMSDRVLLENTKTYITCHDSDQCWGEVCSLHNRTAHHMRKYRQHWRGDRYLMERICEHGVGHPDPDDYTIMSRSPGAGVHGCDGCCRLL